MSATADGISQPSAVMASRLVVETRPVVSSTVAVAGVLHNVRRAGCRGFPRR